MSNARRFVQITAKHQDFPFLTVFLIIKSSFQNINRIGEKCSCERFCKVLHSENYCYDSSNVIATLMMTNFHLNTTDVAIFPNVCLWRRSLCSDLTMKNCIEPPSYSRTAYVVAIWPSFVFDSFVKIWATCEIFLGKWFTAPLAKNFQYAYALPRLTTFSNIGGKIKNREYVCLCRMTINACNNNNNNNNFISTQLYPTLIYMIQNNLIKIYREYRLPIITTEG